jgi:hypothetical protein
MALEAVSSQPGVTTDNNFKIEDPFRDHDKFVVPLPWSQIDGRKFTSMQRPLHALATQNSDDGQEPLEEQPVSALHRARSRGKLAKQLSDSLPVKKSGQSMLSSSAIVLTSAASPKHASNECIEQGAEQRE